jgi:hypothetical protein
MGQVELPLQWFTKKGRPDKHRGVPAYDRGDAGLGRWTRAVRVYATRMIEYGYLSDDPRIGPLVEMLHRMCYDDALVCGVWRLELLYLGSGLPHFRLYWRGRVFGVVGIYTSHADLMASRNIDCARQMLAAYLVFYGWDAKAVRLQRFGARTDIAANVDHQYRLFRCRTIRKAAPRYDVLRDDEREAV